MRLEFEGSIGDLIDALRVIRLLEVAAVADPQLEAAIHNTLQSNQQKIETSTAKIIQVLLDHANKEL